MKYPEFFDQIRAVKLTDPLADILGAFEDGDYEVSYVEVVKGAGHSCPTVAGAYLMTLKALEALYPEGRAIRGDIKVEFKEDLQEGVAGVIGNVISYITGATDKSGFKGLGGAFARHSLMFFNANITSNARFTRLSNGKSVDVFYDASTIPANPNMQPLMQKIMQKQATPQEKKLFGELWQERVEKIFENVDAVVTLK
jgi:hypothetical protein